MGTSIGPQQGGGGGGGGGTSGIDLSLAGNTSGTLTLLSSGTAILAGGSNITLSQNGQSITISGAAGGGIDLSLAGNTSGTLTLISSGTGILAGGSNITLSQNGQSVTISAASQTVQTQNLIDLSLAGNTSGTLTLVSSGTAILAGGNNITLSQNGQSITISANAAAAIEIGGNSTSAGAGYSTIGAGTALFAGGNNITLSQNGASITISQNELTLNKYFWPPIQVFQASLSASAVSNAIYSIQYVPVNNWISFTRVDILATAPAPATTASAVTAAVGVSIIGVLYSLSASSTLNPIVGNSSTWYITWESNNTGNIANARLLSFPLATLIPPGEYWLGLNISSSSGLSYTGAAATTALGYTLSNLFISGLLSTANNVWADLYSATASSSNVQFLGGASVPSATNNTYNLNAISMSGTAYARANVPVIFRNY